jgi:hypothetical protein
MSDSDGGGSIGLPYHLCRHHRGPSLTARPAFLRVIR